ncbi:hypothetical protein LOTGIDRAFT_171454 [Lottia gigantea]|uniref:phosphatidate phosphatase n=1 Tax=Lottia gigantea TaxID=225164 RepID=V4AH75_LOTGI|nr:hypothetical protein LOTGIDRAFT_171454 [Lottia gigantea]ESP03369.1 hypothetical protein LOTGIDRAFT_171454 [Lottia gigantea]
MSGLFGRLFSNVRGFYNEINSATLTGAIDVIITEQEDGTFASSPFHVRFGKMGVIRAREKLVDIEINGIPADIHMKLGEAGEAFFVQEVDEEVPPHLATSPIPSSLELMEEGIKEMKGGTGTVTSTPSVTTTTSISQGEVTLDQSADDFKSAMSILLKDMKSDSSVDENKEEEKPKPLRKKVLKKKKVGGKSSPRVMSASMPEGDGIFDMEVSETSSEEEEVVKLSKSMTFPVLEYDDTVGIGWRKTSFVHPLSDPEISPICSPQASRPPSPVSDTEVDRQRVEIAQQSILLEDTATWEWGDFPKPPSSEMLSTMTDKSVDKEDKDKNKSGKLFRLWKRESSMKQQEADGVYLDDLQLDDPEIAKLYLGSPRGFMSIRDDDCESGRGASLPQSPHSVDGAVGGPVSFLESEVRHLGHVSLSLCGGLSDPDGVNLEKFMQKVVTFGDLCEKPNMINDPDLVVRIHDKGYVNWQVAAPMLISNVVFHKDLPEDTVKSLSKEHMPKKKKSGGSSWFPWRRTIPADTTQEVSTSAVTTPTTPTTIPSSIATTESESFNKTSDSGLNVTTSVSGASSAPTSVHSTPKKEPKPKEESSLSPSEIDSEGSEEILISQSSIKKIPELPPLNMATIHRGESPPDVCKKSLRLTTEQIRKLNLRPGVNEITFSVTTQYQGTTRCTSHVYLWRYDDKIVISDIDGTITKSDVLGQILPILGQDWTQSGITDLFTRIDRNGYKIIYLSARAIGQSKITKDLLKNIRQGELVLPDGPLLLNPASLISAFHREVIVKNPEEFKINCLKDVADLFPLSPFYAGFGNKINDVVAYRALKIPSFRIFTINHRGELTHDLSYKFRSSEEKSPRYTNLSQITDHFFPPLHLRHHTNEFSSVNYWRQPIPDIEGLEGEGVLKLENETK